MNITSILLVGAIFILFLVVICAFVLNSMIDEWEDKNKEDK